MLELIPHRSTGGTAIATFGDAVLGEARSDAIGEPPVVATLGRFSIVGDVRLWNRGELRARAGGDEATVGLDDRHLILTAYARTGIRFLEDLDGDFAFIIWDDERHRALAVRDRFGAKPLYYERSENGIRFATEVKQLVATSPRTPTPNSAAIGEYLTGRYRNPRHTFFAGVEKLPPATYLLVEPGRVVEHRYWTPAFESAESITAPEVTERFRDLLTTSVGLRVGSSLGTVAHLTGGLDSSSITAAAVAAIEQDPTLPPVRTASAVFPDSAADESAWIHETAATQPFAHDDFVPEPEVVEQYAAVMWQTDSPIHNRIRDIWPGTARIARSAGADLVLMGSGGDEVLDQDWILADLLRARRFSQWREGIRAEAAWYGIPRALLVERSLRLASPAGLKRPVRRMRARRAERGSRLVAEALVVSDARLADQTPATSPPAPSETQRLVVASTVELLRVIINEHQEAEYAYGGVDVSYPYLDRSIIEFLATVPPRHRPFDGSSKALARHAFSERLPASVLERRDKSFADEYLATVFDRLAVEYRTRYPTVSDSAQPYLDPSRYTSLIGRFEDGTMTRSDRTALWNAWTLMLWLDGLSRYDQRP